ncbi:MAG TPA: MFS transporter [Candidatus Binataceae bacterium]|nr:MFS transporter [Candidatus Binataceae bacterium]
MVSSAVGRDADRAGTPAAGTAESFRETITIISAIAILLIYQGYTLSIAGVASPWISQSFNLDQAGLARLFAWMSVSAFGSLALARWADRVGRRRIILLGLFLAPLLSAGSAVATNPVPFAIYQIIISALLGGSVTSAIALLAEELPVNQRARGQAAAATASAVGGVLGYLVIPVLLRLGYSWRWLFAPSVAGIVLLWPVARMLPQTQWAEQKSKGTITKSRIYDIFHPIYRRRALALLANAALATVAGTAVNGWLYFEAVSIIGLSPEKASTLVVTGMLVGMIGFPIGAWTSERFGRVPTVTYFGGAAWLGAIAFYWWPNMTFSWPLLWLTSVYCWFKVGSSVMTVGANAAATELFPAALRSTMMGWQMIIGAVFSILAQSMIAALIRPLGGLTNVIGYFALLGIPSALIFRFFIDETRGLPLKVAAKEDEWAKVPHRTTLVSRPAKK